MPRIRTLKPEIASDAKLARVSRDARYTFVLMITQADDRGLIAGAHRQLLGTLYPLDDDVTVPDLLGWIEELVSIEVVRWRETRDGVPALELMNWARHQRIDNAGRSLLAPLLIPLAESPPAAANPTNPAAVRGESRRVAAVRGLEEEGDQGPRTKDQPSPPAREDDDETDVAAVLPTDDDRTALAAVLAAAPSPTSWQAEMRAALQGMHGPRLTPAQLGEALRDYVGNGATNERPGLRHFRGYLQRAARARPPDAPPGTRSSSRRPASPPPTPSKYASYLSGE